VLFRWCGEGVGGYAVTRNVVECCPHDLLTGREGQYLFLCVRVYPRGWSAAAAAGGGCGRDQAAAATRPHGGQAWARPRPASPEARPPALDPDISSLAIGAVVVRIAAVGKQSELWKSVGKLGVMAICIAVGKGVHVNSHA